MLGDIVVNAQIFFLIAVRVLAMVETMPLLSSEAIPQPAKVVLSGFTAFAVFPWVSASGYAPLPDVGLQYAFLLVGEGLIGVIMGFFVSIVFSAFATAGQLFSTQVGFGASETYDPLAEIENPLFGQFYNLVAMLVMLCTTGFREMFTAGLYRSFQSMRAIDLVNRHEQIINYLVGATSDLFMQAVVLAFPMLGTLFIISVATGLLSKAAPQMNLLTEGFPISLSVSYILLFASIPFLMESFSRLVSFAFSSLSGLVTGAMP
jgi:flagellar biosynthesis protein FliR